MLSFLQNGLCSLLLVAVAAGCASIVSKSTYPVTIASNPEGVHVSIVNNNDEVIYEGLSPVTIPLKAGSGYFKNATYEVTLSKEGFKPQTFLIESQIDGWYFGNLALGGPLGMLVIDPLTGAMWKIPTEYYNFTLTPETDEASIKDFRIITLESVPEKLRSKMQPIKGADQQ